MGENSCAFSTCIQNRSDVIGGCFRINSSIPCGLDKIFSIFMIHLAFEIRIVNGAPVGAESSGGGVSDAVAGSEAASGGIVFTRHP